MSGWVDAERRVERAQELYGVGRLAEAAAELRAAIDVNPHNAGWYFNLGLTMEAMEDYERACKAYAAAAKLDPDDLETLSCLGANLTRIGKFTEAIEQFERMEQVDPTFEASYCNRIVTYCEMGRHDQAELMFYLARLFKDRCELCCYNIGASLYARGLYDRAIACWRETLAIDPEYPQARACIAEAYWALGDLDKAKQHYRAELRLDRDDVETLAGLGDLLVELGEYDQADDAFGRVLLISPDNVGAHFGLGSVALKRRELGKAEKHLRRALELAPDYPDAHLELARVLVGRGSTASAVRHLLAELSNCNDDDVETLWDIGRMLMRTRQLHKANTILRRVARLKPADAQAQHGLAVSCFMLDRVDEGIAHCRRALKLKPDYSLALYNLALAHMRKGQIPRARRYAVRAMTISPGNQQIRRLLRRITGGGPSKATRGK